MRARTLLILVALVLLALPAVAQKTPENNAKAPEVTAKAPQVEVAKEPQAQRLQAKDELPGLGLEKTVELAPQPQIGGLCPICPLSFCSAPNRRCDYLGCNRRCCSYNCYTDPSCSSGSCYMYACNC